jgi:hypothetical protein
MSPKLRHLKYNQILMCRKKIKQNYAVCELSVEIKRQHLHQIESKLLKFFENQRLRNIFIQVSRYELKAFSQTNYLFWYFSRLLVFWNGLDVF